MAATLAAGLALSTTTAHSALHLRAGGFVYDDVLDITLLQNVTGFISGGTGDQFADGGYATIEWAAALTVYDPLRDVLWDDFRLLSASLSASDPAGNRTPNRAFTVVDTSTASEVDSRDNEIGYMYHWNGISNAAPGLFTGLDGGGGGTVWSGTEGTYAIKQWMLDFDTGIMSGSDQNRARYAWAVLDGDVGIAAVPEPSSTALLGLGGLAMLLRRKRS